MQCKHHNRLNQAVLAVGVGLITNVPGETSPPTLHTSRNDWRAWSTRSPLNCKLLFDCNQVYCLACAMHFPRNQNCPTEAKITVSRLSYTFYFLGYARHAPIISANTKGNHQVRNCNHPSVLRSPYLHLFLQIVYASFTPSSAIPL